MEHIIKKKRSQKWYDAIRRANSKPKSPEAIAKMAAAKRGKPLRFSDPEARSKKLSEALKGKPFTEEHKRNCAEGRRKSAKWREAMLRNNAAKKGKPIRFSDPEARLAKLKEHLDKPETRARQSETMRKLWAKRTEEQKQAIYNKISAAQTGVAWSPERLARLRAANSKPRTEEHRRKLGACHKGVPSWNAGLTKETHPSVMSNSQKQIGSVPDYRKYRAHYEGPNGSHLMRSRWEVAYAKYLDGHQIQWEYEPKWFLIGEGDWTGQSYTPDFYLPAQNEYLEIKGWMAKEAQGKIDAFRARYPEIKLTIIGPSELIACGLLDKHRRLLVDGIPVTGTVRRQRQPAQMDLDLNG